MGFRTRLFHAVVVVGCTLGCGPEFREFDAGSVVQPADSGAGGGQGSDAGSDAGTWQVDAGQGPDAGADAGVDVDAGAEVDAGLPDAGSDDAGVDGGWHPTK